jgi:hypothetical protein
VDSKTIELLGRNRLVDELLQAGLDVALPVAQRGIDLIVYGHQDDGSFVACPLQLRASSGRKFAIDHTNEKMPNLIYAFVWGVGTEKVATYALTHREMLRVGESTGYSLMQSSQKELYGTSPNRSLLDELERYRMTPESWRQKLAHGA